MDGWSVGVLVVCGYAAVMGLVRLMLARRNQTMEAIQRQVAAARQQRKAAEEQQDAA